MRRRATSRRARKWEFNVEKANQILDAGGWKRGPDEVRVKDGKKLSMLYSTTINAPRQKAQQIVKQAAAKTGIDLQLKAVPASVFFSSDPGNPDTFLTFFADLQMYTAANTSPDPKFFMNQFTSWEASSRENKWPGRNKTRWRNEESDKLFRAQETEIDPVKRAALFSRMNDLVIRTSSSSRSCGARGSRRSAVACARSSRAAGTPTVGPRVLVEGIASSSQDS
jgi:peptide/nickel transport system substrate-binding protein